MVRMFWPLLKQVQVKRQHLPSLFWIWVAADKGPTRGIYALILAPTHELARQNSSDFHFFRQRNKSLCRLRLWRCRSRGADYAASIRSLYFDCYSGEGCLIYLSQGMIDVTHLKMLVLDEADHMLDLGFIDDIRDLIRKVPLRRQNLFFSATINKEN